MMKHARWGVAAGALVGAMMLAQPAAAHVWYKVTGNALKVDAEGCDFASVNSCAVQNLTLQSLTQGGSVNSPGKDQSKVEGLGGDLFIGFVVGDIGNPEAERDSIRDFLEYFYEIPRQKVNLTSISGDSKIDTNELESFGLGPADPKDTGPQQCALTSVGCSVQIEGLMSGWLYYVKYDGLGALFLNDNDNLVEFTLGAGNFAVSHVTFVTPVPAALPMLGAAVAGLGFAGWRRNRKSA